MPWLRKKPFQRLHVSSDYRDDDEVFHCEVTNEIFKDYNEFCERIILCNSTIWSCSITGKTNMTYEEALACEENAKESLKEFPMELRIPILYLASKMNRSSFSEMMEDIYQFARDRYFVGEMVEASFKEDAWCDCHVLQVIEPTETQINEYNKDNPKQNPQERHYDPPSKLFKYEVEQLDDNDDDVTQINIVDSSQIRRKKQLFTRERCKIFLRMLCKQSNNGIWTVKDEIQRKYGIQKIRFDTIFAGPMPQFSSMPKRPVIKQQKQSTLDKFLTNDVSKQQQQQQPRAPITIKTDPLRKLNDPSMQIKKRQRSRLNGKFNELIKAKALEEKTKRKEERIQKRVQQKEEKLKLAALAAYVKEWNKPREDLECEDLRVIPEAVPIKCSIPNKHFGDFALVLEFLQFFKEELEVSIYFPNGFTIEILEKALLLNEASGSWSDLLQLLLTNIFKCQNEEEDEIHESNSSDDIGDNYTDHKISSMAEAVKLATIASSWSQQHHGCKLSELTLDHVTLSEILRQHLLSSGGRNGELTSKWRYSQRGGYTNHDDPALDLRINESRLLRCLGHRSIFEFDLNDRLCIIKCLINQLLTFASIRDVIEERHDKLHQAKRELKLFILAEQKKEREESRLREKEKEKEKEKDDDGKIQEEVSEKLIKTRGSREEDKKREDYENKLTELRQASKDDQMMMYLGSDRAYRRYWRLISIPGIFVENDGQYSYSCIPDGTPYLPELQDKDAADIYLRNKFEDELSDKENSCNKTKKKKMNNSTDKIGVKLSRKDTIDVRRSLMACTDSKDCPVHCKRSEITWSFYTSQDDIDNLIKNLSIRGIREGELVNNLKLEYESIKSLIKNCPVYKLNPELYPPENYPNNNNNNNNNNNSKLKKVKIETTNLNYPSEMEIDQVMELTLRDYVIDFDEKIRAGCLGTLKVKDREAWRREILNPPSNTEDETATNLLLDKIKNETRASRPGTPDSEVGSGIVKTYRDPGKYLGPPGDNDIHPDPKQQANIKQMAGAILQLFQAIEPKYFKKPLGADEKEKKQQQQQPLEQQQQQQSASEEIKERWEQSLLASTSWSQLFLHLNTLENSVAWGRSVFNARCRICRKCRDAENMLLCDGCNKGQHLYCLKPKLTTVPEGDWFCSTCRPKETKPKAKKTKTRRKFEDEDDDEVITKDTKNHYVDDDEEDHKEIVKSTKKQEICSGCGSPGSLIVCDTCPKLFHLDCVEPPLVRAPRGRWSCPECKDLRKSGAKAGTLDSSNSEETETRQTRRATKRAAAVQDKTLHDLLNDVMHHRDSWPFLSPVTADEVPDYYDFIKKPMDFGTIKKKLDNGNYDKNSQHFFNDIQLIFDNCTAYNKEHSTVYKAGIRLSKYFEKKSKEMGITGEETTRRSGPPAKKFKEDSDVDNNFADKHIKVNGNR